ncbi:MAG: RecX family transcriptional regulator [Alphaproteobacteria bacterium]|nr:RecX family transcriptional regulator [Alphaproteobacteria bacterium]
MALLRPMTRSPVPAVDLASLEKAALHYLERYAASRRQVARVLMRRVQRAVQGGAVERSEGEARVESVLDTLAGRGLLDDRLFAEGRARSLSHRGRSATAIRQTLRARGVGDDDVAAALERLGEEVENPELSAALALARRRRLGPYRAAAERATRRDKDLAVLARAGFDRRLAQRIVDAPSIEALAGLADDS